jgi:type II secretory pathway component PulF
MARIPLKTLADLCQRISVNYKAGIDVVRIFKRESEFGSRRHRLAMGKVLDRISHGQTIAEGLRAADDYFPELTSSVAESGETSGRLDRSFQLLAQHYDTILRFRRDMIGRLAWPVFELFAAVVIIALMILGMGWAASIGGSGEPFDLIGWGWTTMQYFWTWISFCLVSLGSVALVIYGSMAGWFGEVPMRIARRIPLIGKTIQVFSLARFAWVLSAVYEAGMNTMRGVALAFRSTQNFYYAQHEEQVLLRLQAGTSLTEALRETGVFPDDLLMYVENGELTGELPESMNRLAEQYNDQAEANLNIISRVMFFVIFSIIAVIIGGLVISLYSRYIGVIQSFS